MDSQIEIKREKEFYQGFIRLKLSVSNKAPSVITNVNLDFSFDENLLRIDRYEPSSYQTRNGKIVLGNIDPGKSKSIAVLFDPLVCSEGTDINCSVTYKDALGKFNSDVMDPKTISVICPVLKTDSDINVGRLKEFIEKLQSKDSRVYKIRQGFEMSKLSSIAREVVEKHDVRHVRTLETKDGKEREIWYYGKTTVKGNYIVIKVSISSEKQLLELFVAAETAEVLAGLLAEVGRNLKESIESLVGSKGNVINVMIRNSLVQNSNLLDLCSADGSCPVNILVEDSVIQRSTLFSERDKFREEGDARRDREEQERIRKQREEAGRRAEFERRAGEELEKKKSEEASRAHVYKLQSPAQSKVPQESFSSFSSNKKKSSFGKRIIFFGLILTILLTGAPDDSSPEIPIQEEVSFYGITSGDDTDISSAQSQDIYTNSIGMKLVKVQAGEFSMGSPSGEEGRNRDEGPGHQVTIEKPFYLGKFEVTQKQWREVMGSNPSNFKGDNLPVEKVSWDDVQEFIKKLNEKEGTDRYRLPSEAEWEYACRAGTSTRFYFGDDESELGYYGWYSDNSGGRTHSVGQKEPNPWGLYDMYGNVDEWVQDGYHGSYEGAPSDGSVWKIGSSSGRVYRGGGWGSTSNYCRSAVRYYDDPVFHYSYLGFRVLREI